MKIKTKVNHNLSILLFFFVIIILFAIPNLKESYDFQVSRKNYPNAVEVKSNSVYSQNGLNIGIGSLKLGEMFVSITKDSDTKYFNMSQVHVGTLIEDVEYKIWIRGINTNSRKALIEVENTNKD